MKPANLRCSVCKEPTDMRFRPFCSARCKDIDLSRWLTGSYAIAGGKADADDDSDDPSLESSAHLASPTPRTRSGNGSGDDERG